MKGVVFNLLEGVVRSRLGDNTWDDLLDAAGVDGAYTSLGNYSDHEMGRLVQAAAQALGQSADEVLRWFGRHAMAELAERYPAFFCRHSDTRSFLLTLNDIIHPEVNKLYPGASTPVFDFDSSGSDVLLMGYQSSRKLCALAHGFIEGAGDHYRETVALEHHSCMLRGDAKCLFRMRFSPPAAG